MKRNVTIRRFNQANGVASLFGDRMGFLRLVRILWQFWKHYGTRLDDFNGMTICISEDSK